MIHVVKIENVYKTASGREAALRRYVFDSQSLNYEFSNRYYSPDRIVDVVYEIEEPTNGDI